MLNELIVSIAVLCGLSKGADLGKVKNQKIINCIEYYANCAIKKGGEWDHKGLTKCVKRRKQTNL